MTISRSDVKVPEGMLKAAVDATCDSRGNHYESVVRPALEAALQWLSEHPIVPTLDQAHRLSDIYHLDAPEMVRDVCTIWQRRMFLAEPEIPEELTDMVCVCSDSLGRGPCKHTQRLVEAFRRGQRSKGSE